jgi:hypothetical protein
MLQAYGLVSSHSHHGRSASAAALPLCNIPARPLFRDLGYPQSHLQTLIIHKLGFNQNYYTPSLILLTNIVLCGKFS